ncbi:MAG: hypothetical protein O7J95_12855, partial [Planctomycetota bacterium]|nr:hypothetical protein [Planctomycetota bacterium]
MPRCGKSSLIILCSFLAAPAASAGDSPGTELRGKWVLDANGAAVEPESFRRGLQSSGLFYRDGELWSVGDQRSRYPGHLFRLDPRSARLAGPPVRLRLPEPRDGENPHFRTYRDIPNSDFEGAAAHPTDPSRLYAVTENKAAWLVEIRLESRSPGQYSPRITQMSEVVFPEKLEPWRGSDNFHLEGIAIADDGETVYLAYERASDDLPRILVAKLAEARGGARCRTRELPIPFAEVPRRRDKAAARLNVNGIQFLRWKNRPYLIAVARDQERILVIDLAAKRVSHWVDLDLRDAAGGAILWVSPEGLACDVRRDRLWIINDPDSVRGNYRARDEETASGHYAD